MCDSPRMACWCRIQFVGGLVLSWAIAMPIATARGALLGTNLFPADNPWNQNISQAPVATNSAAIMSSIIATYGNGRFHPDFGQDYQTADTDLYGIPYNVVHGNTTARVHVVIDAYPDQSDLLDAPIPANAVIEGDMQTGPTVGVDNRGDSHLLVWDEDNNVAYEFYRASRPSENTDGQWHADQESVWDMKTNTFRTLGWTSADAAGLPILPGLARPDEALPASQGGQGIIRHALRFTLPNAVILNQYLYPGSHTANPGNTNRSIQPPMGARFRLKASVDISSLNPQSKVVAQALKDYGLIVADNGSAFFMTGASYSVDSQQPLRPHVERRRHPGYGAWAQKPPVYQFRGSGPQPRDYQREPDPGGRGNFRDDYRPQLLRGGRPAERVVRHQPGAGHAH